MGPDKQTDAPTADKRSGSLTDGLIVIRRVKDSGERSVGQSVGWSSSLTVYLVSFLDASSHLYKRVCPLVGLSVWNAKISKRDF